MTADAKSRLLDAALRVFREKGYTATTVDDLCRAAGVTKGAFFHHFGSKEAATLAAIEYWNTMTGALFANAPYQHVVDPRERLFAYIDFRAALIAGDAADFSCLLGTLLQEVHDTQPGIQAAAGAGIEAHVETLVTTIEAARRAHAPDAAWDARAFSRYIQAVLQGAFVLAKATGSADTARDCVAQLRADIECRLPKRKRSARIAATPKGKP